MLLAMAKAPLRVALMAMSESIIQLLDERQSYYINAPRVWGVVIACINGLT